MRYRLYNYFWFGIQNASVDSKGSATGPDKFVSLCLFGKLFKRRSWVQGLYSHLLTFGDTLKFTVILKNIEAHAGA